MTRAPVETPVEKAAASIRQLITALDDIGDLEERSAQLKTEVDAAAKTLQQLTKHISEAKTDLDRVQAAASARRQDLAQIEREIEPRNILLGNLETRIADIRAKVFS